MKCSSCSGALQRFAPPTGQVVYVCRHCKILHDEGGARLTESGELRSAFEPLRLARQISTKTAPGLHGVAKAAVETAFVQGLSDAYLQGLRDGVLLAYSLESADKRVAK